MSSFKEALQRSSSTGIIRRLTSGEVLTVRFLYEMEDEVGWCHLWGYYDEDLKRTIYIDKQPTKEQRRKRIYKDHFFAVAIAEDTGEAHVFELRKSLAISLNEHEVEYGSISDRPYKLRRKGEGLETKYSSTPLDKSELTKEEKKVRKGTQDLLDQAMDILLDVPDDDDDDIESDWD